MIKPTSDAWALIENEKRRDRFIRRVAITAWSVTFAIVLILAVMVGVQVAQIFKAFGGGFVPFMTVVASAMPLISVLLILSALIATLSTVGIFLRLRTASLAEIQLRLAALEEILASRPEGE
jgi:uncharacterized membrane protein